MTLMSICEQAVKKALAMGADEVEAYASSEREFEVALERNDVNIGKSHHMSGIGVRIFKKKALGYSSSNDISKKGVEGAVERALTLARSSPPDANNQLPDRKKLGKVKGLFDKKALDFTLDEALEHATSMFSAAKDFDRRVSVDSGAFMSSIGSDAISTSTGIEAEEEGSLFQYFIGGMAVDGDEVSTMDYNFDGTHMINEIDVERVSEEFAEMVVKSLGAKKIDSFKGSVILTPFTAGELLGYFISHSCNSNNVQKKASRFAGMLGKEVASDLLSVADDGTLPGGLGSSSFDREGLPHRPMDLIKKGVLKNYMYNSYTARKEGRISTAHASGSTRAPPSIGPTNFMIQPGDCGWRDMVKDVRKGLLVNRFSGFPQVVSGDFSGVVKGGWLIDNGELVKPVIETMIAGNLFELMKNISQVSKERKKMENFIIPYIRIDDVSVTGG